jgi:type IV secretory pathway VirB10-like protein
MTLAMGGDFYDVGGEGDDICFQPLAGIDDESELGWAQEWLLDLLHREKTAITPATKQELWAALTNLASMPRIQRTLSTLLGLVQDADIRQALRSFTLDGPHGRLLDANHDTLAEFAADGDDRKALSRWQAFEMEHLMQSRAALLPVLTYLFRRLEKRFDGSPTLLVLDEAWLYLTESLFAAKIREWLKVLRKKNVSVIFATQSLSDIADSTIAPAIIENCPTRIFLPNGNAMEERTRKVYESTQPGLWSLQDKAIAEQLRQMDDLRRKLLEQQRKDQDQALDSPLIFAGAKSVPVAASGSLASAAPPPLGRTDPLTLASLLGSAAARAARPSDAGAGAGGVLANHQNEKEAFRSQAAAIEPYLSKPLLTPLSKYELNAGSLIPGALVTSINTDLPGEIIGQVTENVYDSASGNYLLVPQGSRLLGKYQSLVTNGQNRALLVWQRLIYPNGNSIVLDGMAGTDQIGQSGLSDQVDYHLDKLVEATALSTALAFAGNLARDRSSNNGNSNGDVIGDTVAQQADRVGEKFIDRELDVQPTITIRSGWPFRVLVNKDMVLEPYTP